MAEEICDGTARVRQLFREGERVPDEAGDTLPHGVLEALEMMGCAGVLRDGFMLRCGNAPRVDRGLIRRECRLLAVHRGQLGPQLWRARVTARTDVEGHALPCLRVHRDPPPWLVRFFRHNAPPLSRFDLQPPTAPLSGSRDRQHMSRSRQRRTAGDPKAQKPPETDTSCPAHAMEGTLLAEPAFHEGALCFANHPVVGLEDTWATTRRAVMVLLPSLSMTIALQSLGTTCWTRFSHDPNALLPPYALVFLPTIP